jgi:GT2 family glycosyltransferase
VPTSAANQQATVMVTSRARTPAGPALLAIVVLHYNNLADTQACITSLLAAGASDTAELFVVDNASPDGSGPLLRAWLREQLPQVIDVPEAREQRRPPGTGTPVATEGSCTFIQNDENRGYGPGNNSALNLIVGRSPRWCWVLNNDTVITAANYQRLLGHLRRRVGERVILGTRIHTVGQADNLDIMGGGTLQPWLGRTRLLTSGARQRRDRGQAGLNFISGSSMIISEPVLAASGSFVTDHFLFWEEIDYATRAIRHGTRLDVLDDVTVVHHQGRTSGARPGCTSPSATYYSTRSAILYFGTFRSRFLVAAMVCRLGHAVSLAGRGRVDQAWAAVSGLAGGVAALRARRLAASGTPAT